MNINFKIEQVTALKTQYSPSLAFVEAMIAWRGLSTWQRQLRGQADFEAARGAGSRELQAAGCCAICQGPLVNRRRVSTWLQRCRQQHAGGAAQCLGAHLQRSVAADLEQAA